MIFYLPFLFSFSLILTAVLYYFWMRIPEYRIKGKGQSVTFISVLVAVRNEADNIESLLSDLENQTYDKQKFEVVIVDDHSEDTTNIIVEQFIKNTDLQVRLISLPETLTGKKKAITEGAKKAKGSLLVTTDGDCNVNPDWLMVLENFYREKKLKMVTGAVTFKRGTSFRERVLELEFASLVGSGAASLQMGYPSMCNGANLAFDKEAFESVNGYEDSLKLSSGDDEFLMHKIYRKYPGKVAFVKNEKSVVETAAPKSWKLFFEQRRRWASKWENYTYTHIKILALLVFASNVALLLNFILSPMESYPIVVFLLLLVFKFMLEFLFLRTVL
ncbi:MAG TPA: glycosyltransferase, partial [Cytophagaceae bacterium]|nr:glycosyltransferase [Cytophagaceae bacterium]